MSPLALSLRFLQAQPDSRLVALARDGHSPAFEALVRRYRKELLGYCRRFKTAAATSEDILQQALLQAWKALSAGAEVRDVRPWLYRITHNVAISYSRSPTPIPEEMAESAGGQEVDQLVEQRFQARAALAGMASLPELQRQVFVSTALDGASHEEVAQALGLSSGAVRGLIYRARTTLRAAAAAITPSPALAWAVRRLELRGAGASTWIEALAGGGGAGVAGLVLKGGAVITLAGAVAGGGVALTHAAGHHHHSRSVHASSVSASGSPARAAPGAQTELAAASAAASGGAPGADGSRDHGRGPLPGQSRGDHHGGELRLAENGSGGGHDGGPSSGRDGGSSGGSDGGSSGGSGDRHDGGTSSGALTASSGGGSGDGGSRTSGGSDGGGGSTGSHDGAGSGLLSAGATTSGSGTSGSGTSGSGSSGSGGGTSGGSGSQVTTTVTTTDGSSGSDGGRSGGSGSSGSSDTTTTTTSGSH